jgi:hypothetical protein
MTAGKSTAQVPGLCGRLATAISLGFTAADVAAQEVAPKVMTAEDAVYSENSTHARTATAKLYGSSIGRTALMSLQRRSLETTSDWCGGQRCAILQ